MWWALNRITPHVLLKDIERKQSLLALCCGTPEGCTHLGLAHNDRTTVLSRRLYNL